MSILGRICILILLMAVMHYSQQVDLPGVAPGAGEGLIAFHQFKKIWAARPANLKDAPPKRR